MTWVKLDDAFPLHPKVAGLSDRAFRAHVAAMCYAGQYETDGFIPAACKVRASSATELIASGLWSEAEGGWVIHDFLKYNPSREQLANERRSSAERMRRVRGEVRENTGSGKALGSKEQGLFEEFWAVWPRKVGRRAAERAFAAACKRAEAAEILAGAVRYRDDPHRSPQFTKHPSTWLNADCWLDEPEVAAPPEPKRDIHVAEEPDEKQLAEFAAMVKSMPWVANDA